jgi:HSP20 family molecular chaperone IbpA
MTQFQNKMIRTSIEPWEVLFRNFFDTNTIFAPVSEVKPKYPIDIYEKEDGIYFDIAIVGLSADDIKIEVTSGNTLNVSYDKEESVEVGRIWIQHGIAKRAFSFGWKIGNSYDLSKIEAEAERGLLTIFIPLAPDKKPQQIVIKSKEQPYVAPYEVPTEVPEGKNWPLTESERITV